MREQRPSRTRRSAISVIGVLLVGMLAVVAIGPGAALAQREETIYRIDTGDKLSVRVFNEPDLSGEFVVDDQGQVSLPLIGNVEFQGRSVREAEGLIEAKLKDGYLKQPRVSVEVLNYRPFFILGEVKDPGSYPYVNGMTVLTAVALAGGYTYRAAKSDIAIVRDQAGTRREVKVSEESVVLPGDTIRVPERFF